MKAAIYLRVSTQGQTTELQLHEISTFVQARGWDPHKIYEDKLSGTTTRRPALQEMVTDIRAGKVNVVVVWKLDRIFRSLRDLVSHLQEFNERGVQFVSLKDQIDLTTASGRLLVHLLGAFSEFEASLIRERVCAGLENAKRKGIKLGRPRTLDVEQIMTLRRKGYSLMAIAKELGVTKSGVSKTLTKLALQPTEITELPRSKNGVS